MYRFEWYYTLPVNMIMIGQWFMNKDNGNIAIIDVLKLQYLWAQLSTSL